MAEYRNHDPLAVMKTEYYGRHVAAMTAEDLHGKGEIAEELAFRDMEIATLKLAHREMEKSLFEAVAKLKQTAMEASRLQNICVMAHDRFLRADTDIEILEILERAWKQTPNARLTGATPEGGASELKR